MGNEMGNNNVTGLQASEENAYGVDETNKPLDGSLVLSNADSKKDTEEDGAEDAAMTQSLKDPIISKGADVEEVSDHQNSSTKAEDLDEKNMGSDQNDTSTADDDQNNRNKSEERDDEAMRSSVKEEMSLMPTVHLVNNETVEPSVTSVVISLPPTMEIMISNKDSSGSDENIDQLVDVIKERIEEGIITNSSSSLEDIDESSTNEIVLMDGNLVEEDKIETLEQQHLQVATVENEFMPVQREITSSSESINTDYLDADDSEIKEVMEDEPKKRDNMQPIDDINLETSDDCNTQKPGEKVEISEIDEITALESMIYTSEELKQDNRMCGLDNKDHENPEYNIADDLQIGEVVFQLQSPSTNASATLSEVIMEKKEELKEEGIISARKISDDATEPVEHYETERTHKEEEESVTERLKVQNLADHFGADKELEEFNDKHNLVDCFEVSGDDFMKLEASLFNHLPFVSEEKVGEKEVNGGLVAAVMIPANATETLGHDEETIQEIKEPDETGNAAEERGLRLDGELAAKEERDLFHLPTSMPLSTLQSVLDFDKNEDIKLGGSDSNKGIITSAYEANTGNTQEGVISSQCDQVLPEEPEVVKLENSVILSSCKQSVEHSSTTIRGFAPEFNKEKDTATAEKTMKDHYHLQTAHSGGEACEDAPLLQITESMDCFGYSSHTKGQHVSVAIIGMLEVNGEEEKHPISTVEEESEKSPLLSPKKPSEGEFRVPNHSGRYKRPLQSLMTEDRFAIGSPEKEQGPLPKNLVANSPRSKGKQKAKCSLFASCMCCTTATN